MEEGWYVVQEGKPTGPYPLSELKQLNIHPGTFLKTAGMDDYKEAHELPQLRKLLGFKRELVLPQYFATLDIRLLALVIDYFLVSIASAIPALLIIVFADQRMLKAGVALAWFLLLPLIKTVYASVMESSARQGTFGKSWLGLKVCDEEGRPVNEQKAFIRNISKFLSFLTLGIGYVAGFFSPKQQCLHDRIAGTLVVKGRLV